MDEKQFVEDVGEFAYDYCHEYMRDVKVEFDKENYEAIIKCSDYFGLDWEIPICVLNYDNCIAINIGDAGSLSANSGGLYAFLWNQACARLREKNREE